MRAASANSSASAELYQVLRVWVLGFRVSDFSCLFRAFVAPLLGFRVVISCRNPDPLLRAHCRMVIIIYGEGTNFVNPPMRGPPFEEKTRIPKKGNDKFNIVDDVWSGFGLEPTQTLWVAIVDQCHCHAHDP